MEFQIDKIYIDENGRNMIKNLPKLKLLFIKS